MSELDLEARGANTEDSEEFLSSVCAEVRDCIDSVATRRDSLSPDDIDTLAAECGERVADLAQAWLVASAETLVDSVDGWIAATQSAQEDAWATLRTLRDEAANARIDDANGAES